MKQINTRISPIATFYYYNYKCFPSALLKHHHLTISLLLKRVYIKLKVLYAIWYIKTFTGSHN